MRRLKLIAVALAIICSSSIYAQLHSVKLFAEYSSPNSKRLAVKNIDAVGGGIKIRFDLFDKLSLNANIAYNLYSLTQDSAIVQWDWRFWGRYEDFIEQTLQDDLYEAGINPIQKMDAIPIYLTFSYDLELSEKISVLPYVGGGIIFYNRRLYIREDWIKQFEEIDFEFAYSFRNIAPQKSGNPLFISGGVEVSYKFAEYFSANGSVNYLNVLKTEGKFGFENFPFDKAINFNIGVGFIY
jgi:hypothetical protein